MSSPTLPLTPELAPDALLIEAIEEAFEDIRVGVVFDSSRFGRVYAYLAPPTAHVESLVIVPPSWFDSNPKTATVITLEPPPYPGPLKRVLAVLS